jgi:hypothetical protein
MNPNPNINATYKEEDPEVRNYALTHEKWRKQRLGQ